jgi:hypothetical protein
MNTGGMDDLLVLAASILTVSSSPSPLEGKSEPVPGGRHKLEAVYGGHGRDLFGRGLSMGLRLDLFISCANLFSKIESLRTSNPPGIAGLSGRTLP